MKEKEKGRPEQGDLITTELATPIIPQKQRTVASFDNIPTELKSLKQWVVWEYETRNEKATKVPKQTDGRNASTNRPNTWTTFATAAEAYCTGSFDGIGFCFSENDPFVGVDLDKIDGWKDKVDGIIRSLDSYTEVSPSGNGYRVFVKGKKPGKNERKAGHNLEIYDHTSTRFLTLTGNHVPGLPTVIEERQEAVERLYYDYLGVKEVKPPKPNTPPVNKLPDSITDEEVWQAMFESEAEESIHALYDGDLSGYNGDHSAADLALCAYLAWFTKKDEQRIDRMFRQTKLYRPKWDEYRGELKYGEMTIQKAVTGTELPEERLAAARQTVADTMGKVAAGDKKAALGGEMIGALALLQDKAPADFAKVKIDLKQYGLPLRDIEKAINLEMSQLRLVKSGTAVAQPKRENTLRRDWVIDANGCLCRRKLLEEGWQNILITRTAPTIQKVLIAEQSGLEYWDIGFKTVRGRQISVHVSREGISTRRGIITELAGHGFDIGEDNARDVIKYLRDYAAAYAQETEEQRFVEHFGWSEGYSSFVIGNDVIGSQDVIFKAPGTGEQQLADGFTISGTFEGWKQLTRLIGNKPWSMFKLYQAFLPPLLPILRTNGYALANWGESSEGKTLTDQIAVSVWGNPNYKGEDPSILQQGRGMTNDRLEKGLAVSRHLPYFLQDAHEARADIAAALHNVEMGQTSPKGDISNGSRKVKQIRTVWFITSETSITGLKPQGGIAARVIEKNGSPLAEKNPLLAHQIERAILEHYGHAGRRFIEYLIANRERWDEWRRDFMDMQEEAIQQTADLDNKVSRMNKAYIAVLMAGVLADEALGLGLGQEKIEQDIGICLNESRETMDTRPYYDKALDVLREWIVSNRNEFYIVGSNSDFGRNVPGVWNEKEKFVAMFPERAKEILELRDYDIRRCSTEWRDKGYINPDPKGKSTKATWYPPVKITQRMYQFTYAALGFDDLTPT
ncbi:DUF927 domain-containing protein [Paenibacillus alginolyticus]|uniref:phage NrS-1 polymerase family protein n=1 Tax=Paenibacillus alginolyticus TaxID=59839 RepID=UPI000408473A|nr:DUF927 domain-containing protein [Paenibacillus alginolyticus]MCY9666709.1 DUF927 domain-containing protein [Paenibacillus alginolyticus]